MAFVCLLCFFVALTRSDKMTLLCFVSFVCVIQQSVSIDSNISFIGNTWHFVVLFVSLFPVHVAFLCCLCFLCLLCPTVQYQDNIGFELSNNAISVIYQIGFELFVKLIEYFFALTRGDQAFLCLRGQFNSPI